MHILKKYRINNGLTRKEVSNNTGITEHYIFMIEKGKIPSLKVIKKLSDYMGMSMEELRSKLEETKGA